MSELNKRALTAANAAIASGDIEQFLLHCADDIVWTTVGEPPIVGKEAVRQWMKDAYAEPPRFTVEQLVAEGDWVVALGTIQAEDAQGVTSPHSYSDVWRFEDGKMVELRAFVIKHA